MPMRNVFGRGFDSRRLHHFSSIVSICYRNKIGQEIGRKSQEQLLAFFISKFTYLDYQSRISKGILKSEVEPAFPLFLPIKTIYCNTPHHFCTISTPHQTQITSNKIQLLETKIKIQLRGFDKIDLLATKVQFRIKIIYISNGLSR